MHWFSFVILLISMVRLSIMPKRKSQTLTEPEFSKLEEMLQFDSGIIASGTVAGDTASQLNLFENECTGVIGVDEVGRGCLAGPVVAAAVMFKNLDCNSEFHQAISILDDSKKLSQSQREKLSTLIKAGTFCAIAQCSNDEIDEINILQASLLAMRKAVYKLIKNCPMDLSKSTLLIDGNKRVKTRKLTQITVIKGDSKSASIAAASVVAKVYRDNLMVKLAKKYPQYLWESNKGYPSKVHKQAIQEHGLTPLHRKTFRWQPKED